MKNLKYIFFSLVLISLLSCSDDNDISFEKVEKVGFLQSNTQLSEESSIDSVKIIVISNPAIATNVDIAVVGDELSYGESFTTFPEAINNTIKVNIGTDGIGEFYFIGKEINITRNNEVKFIIKSAAGVNLGQQAVLTHIVKITNVYVLNQKFNKCNIGLPQGWTIFSEASSANWDCSANLRGQSGENGDYAMEIVGLGADVASADWLITPAINLSAGKDYSLDFASVKRAAGPDLEVRISTNYSGTGDPNNATWVNLVSAQSQLDNNESSFEYKQAAPSILDQTGKIHIGFFYSSEGIVENTASLYRIDNVRIKATDAAPGNGDGGNDGGSDDVYSLPFTDNFDDCSEDFAAPSKWIEVFGAGSKEDRGWGCRPDGVDGTRGVRASAFGGDEGEDNAWLVTSKPLDLTSVSTAFLNVDVTSLFDGIGDLKVHYSINYSGSGSPDAATWIELTDVASQLPAKGSSSFVAVQTDISAAAGSNAYLAFQYVGGTSAASGSYSIDNVSITENADGSGSGGGDGGSGSGTTEGLFSDDFNNCTTDYVVPSKWNEINIDGSKTDRGWGCRAFGVDDTRAVNASSFGGDEGSDNAWLITKESINLTSISTAVLNFDVTSGFDGPGTLKLLYSTDYSGSGAPSTGTWIELDVASQLPAKGSQTYVSVTSDMSSAVGNNIYFAMQFEGGTNTASCAYTIDNIIISEN